VSTNKNNDKKRWRFKIYHFNPETKLFEATETCTTKPMSEPDFRDLLRRELSKVKGGYCYEVLVKFPGVWKP
jgi:hypothetical protein